MTQPDGTMPSGAFNSTDFGPISTLATTTQSDWQNQLFSSAQSPFDFIGSGLFGGLFGSGSFVGSIFQTISQLFTGFLPGSGSTGGILDSILGFLGGSGSSDAHHFPMLMSLFGGLGGGTTISGSLIGNLDASKVTTGIFDFNMTGTQGLLDTIFGGLSNNPNASGHIFPDLMNLLGNIPFTNILGVGGPQNIGTSVTSGWDNLISGFVGQPGTQNASLADMFNVPYQVSSNATRGGWAFDILGIRNNKSMSSGLLPTSESTFSLNHIASGGVAPTFAATQSSSPIGFQRVNQSSPLGVVSWLGGGTTNISAFHVNIWKMNPANGDMTLAHHSANVVGSLSPAVDWNTYTLPADQEIAAVAGDVYGTELVPIGSGTHNIVGQSTWLPDHPSVYPKRMGAHRDNSGGATPPDTVASASVAYTSTIPWVELAIKSGDVSEYTHNPLAMQLVAGAVIPIPDWANLVDYIILGGGGGGYEGHFAQPGKGGLGGSWAVGTWVRDTHFSGTGTSVTAVIGAGGIGGSGAGDNGGDTTVSIPGYTVTGAGGAGGTSSGSPRNGGSPGNTTYNSIPYYGGAQQNSAGADGNTPGGGGAGGDWPSNDTGGNGARGVAFLVFRQE